MSGSTSDMCKQHNKAMSKLAVEVLDLLGEPTGKDDIKRMAQSRVFQCMIESVLRNEI